MRAVSLIGRDVDRFAVTGIHSHNSLLKPWNDLALPDGELQSRRIAGAVEFSAVLQRPAVVHANRIALLGCGHNDFLYVLKALERVSAPDTNPPVFACT